MFYVILRYRYRIEPTTQQRVDLARLFGCVRLTYNAALAERRRAWEIHEDISDFEVQKRVTTDAKATPERAFLKNVSCVPLQQACRDAANAHRQWRAAVRGWTPGWRGAPRFRSRRSNYNSARFVGNGFSLRGDRLHVGRIGVLKVKWSRDLPSRPSSVTIIQEPDGKYYASFVVDRDERPLAPVPRSIGVDLGLTSFAVTYSTDGVVEKIPNPRFRRAGQKRIAKMQRRWARKQSGSKNQEKARVKLARAHAKVRHQRFDHHHKLALRLVRENQAIGIEDLNVRGLRRTKMAKSVHDASWGRFRRLLKEKAHDHGRTIVVIDMWEPTSQRCSGCQVRGARKRLDVRSWACEACGVIHDRDVNAAKNILVAAGLAETRNAPGGSVRPGESQAAPVELGTHRSVA